MIYPSKEHPMKKFAAVAAIFLLVVMAGYSQTFSFKAGAGLGSVSTGDVAAGVRGISDLLKVYYSSVGKFEVPSLGPDFYAELIYHLSPSAGIGFGAGYFFAGKQSSIQYSIDTLDISHTVDPKVGVIPVTVTFHFFPALSSKIRLDIGAGAGLYIANLKYEELISLSNLATGTLQYKYESGGRMGFGFQGGIGLEYALSPTLALVAGVQGRFASVTLADGKWVEQGTEAFGDYLESGNDHKAWYYDWTPVEGDRAYAQLVFQKDTPSGTDLANVRQAKLGLTGFVFTVGIRVGIGKE